MSVYDFLIVGAGLFGSVFAHEATRRGKKCLVVERRGEPGGNLRCESVSGIDVHRYGPHIFHTERQAVWEYAGRFVRFNHFRNAPLANYRGALYNLPFNMNTFYRMWGVTTPEEARKKIEEQREGIKDPANLEEQAIRLVGRDLYETLIKGYTEKQWGRPCSALPAFLMRRLPVRFTFDNSYYDDPYQGVPAGGYNPLIEALLAGSDLETRCDYLAHREELDKQADAIVYTGPMDAFYTHRYGALAYRSLTFETELLAMENYQGNAVVNYTDGETAYTRIIEHKHFAFGRQRKTVITREYPKEWTPGAEPYYPVNDAKNQMLYQKYKRLADQERRVSFGGRLAEYTYYDMDETILCALRLAGRLL